MTYDGILTGIFLRRPNRFIAEVEVGGRVEVCHVKNTGRMGELLIPGVEVFIQPAANPERRTRFTLIAVRKGWRVINIDSMAPNTLFREWVERSGYFGPLTLLQPEKSFGTSRFDYYLETEQDKIFVEVKGVTLERDNHAYFPDAPTQRGVKHLYELIAAHRQGYRAAVAFMVKIEAVTGFSPNDETHPALGEALRAARDAGVEVLTIGCTVTPDRVEPVGFLPLVL